MQNQHITVLIIGAGVAGLKAAHKLVKKQKKLKGLTVDYKIIEGADYVGGRVCSGDFMGTTLEEGAHMIFGTKKLLSKANPIYKKAKKADLNTSKVSYSDPFQVVDASDPSADPKKLKKDFEKLFYDYYKGVEKAAKKLYKSDLSLEDDMPVRAALDMFGGINPPQTRVENLVEQFFLDYNFQTHPDDISAYQFMLDDVNDQAYGETELAVHDQRGMAVIFYKLLGELTQFKARLGCPESQFVGTPSGAPTSNSALGGTTEARRAGIWLNHQVRKVEYSSNGVQVTAWDSETGQEAVFHGDYVVSTVSFGVLKKNLIDFSPQLPSWKQAALNEVTMGHMTKVFLNFKQKFWDDVKDLFVANQVRGHFPYFSWVHPKSYKKHGKDWPAHKNCLIAMVNGNEALRLDHLSEDKIKDEIEAMFTSAFQSKAGQYDFRPTDIKVVRWSNNPFTQGATCVYPVKALTGQVSFDHLREPIDPSKLEDPVSQASSSEIELKSDDFLWNRHPRLFFAGDGFDFEFSGTLQGAYFSGKRAAKQILKLVQ